MDDLGKPRYYLNDTATVEAELFDDDGLTYLPATSATLTVRKPTSETTVTDTHSVTQTHTTFNFTGTDVPGLYYSAVQFTLANGNRRTVPGTFEIIDPIQSSSTATDPNSSDAAVDYAWMKLEDLFDSELGGPHLRDRTLASFNRDKMARFVPDAMYMINNTYQPAASFDNTTFPYTQHLPLLAQGVLVSTIKHLMRSYVEQPNPVGGGNITYFDRRDYLQRWQQLFTIENQQFMDWMDLFKKDQMGFGMTSTLVGGYASWYGRYPRYMRGRYPYIARY